MAQLESRAQEIRIQGSVSFSFDQIRIEPGGDFDLEAESTDKVNLDIKKLTKNAYWTVMVSKNDVNWDSQVKIYVRRTSSGDGKGFANGGWNYILINNLNSTFLTGYEKLNNIDLQYKVEGMDVSMEAGTYYTDIVYTLFED
ncbi:MAG: hypothetical protein GC181_00195 [Bacteroidetes bacterium]|nr:hypothetical protein [Bacteroidota bacterium]